MLEDRARTYVTVTRFPDGDVKVSGCHRPMPGSRHQPSRRLSAIELQEKAAKRAATKVRDLTKFFQLGYLHTLTYRGPVMDRRRVLRDFKAWVRIVRRVFPNFLCLAVLEFHRGGGVNDGGIHLHYATDDFYPVSVLRSAWWRVVGEAQGNIQIERKIFRDSYRRVAAYIAKYVAKDFSDLPREFGQHRYLRSAPIKVPQEKLVYFRGAFRDHLAAAKTLLIFNMKGSEIFSWLSEDGWQFVFKSYG